jgi:hypothetical protein
MIARLAPNVPVDLGIAPLVAVLKKKVECPHYTERSGWLAMMKRSFRRAHDPA